MRVLVAVGVVIVLSRTGAAKTAVIGADEAGRAPDAGMVATAAGRVKDVSLAGVELVQALRLDGTENAVLDGRAAVALSNRVARGLQAWRAGDFQRAIGELEPARDELLLHPAWVAEDVAHRDLLRGSLLGLAMSLKRLGKPNAIEVMGEVVRSFPESAPDRQTFGPEVVSFHSAAKRGLEARGRGRLHVTVADPDAIIFLNERFEGAGTALERGDLVPGTYRVFARHGTRIGLVHLVDVMPGATANLEIELDLEENLAVTDRAVTLREVGAAAAARTIGRLAVRLAVDQVAVVRVRAGQQHVEVFGRTGEPVVTSAAAAPTPVAPPLAASPEAATVAAPWYRDSWGWTLVGLGGAGLATGGYLLWSASELDSQGRDESDPQDARDLFDRADGRATLGWITVGAAALVTTGGIWKLMATDAGTPSSIAVTANGVQVWGSF